MQARRGLRWQHLVALARQDQAQTGAADSRRMCCSLATGRRILIRAAKGTRPAGKEDRGRGAGSIKSA